MTQRLRRISESTLRDARVESGSVTIIRVARAGGQTRIALAAVDSETRITLASVGQTRIALAAVETWITLAAVG